MRILTESAGSLVSATMIRAIQEAGHQAVASDVDPEVAGRYLADDFVRVPSRHDPELWSRMAGLLAEHRVDLVIPSFDHTLLGWAEQAGEAGVVGPARVIVSPAASVATFMDKWRAHEFFAAHGIPTAETSLEQRHEVQKPRWGSGSRGIRFDRSPIDMTGMISQERLRGEEYTIDVLCDLESRPVYIVPRKRIGVSDGKSTRGVTVRQPVLEDVVRRICAATTLRGPINVQCFLDGDDARVVEVNPRTAGGIALGMAATENWVPLIVAMLRGETVRATTEPRWGLRMLRHYAEQFVPAD